MESADDIDSTLEKTRTIADALGVEERGAELVAKVEVDWAEASAKIEALDFEPTVLFFTAVGDGTPQAAGIDTAAHGVIEMIAVAADPDIILAMAHNAAQLGGKDKIINHPALSLTTAAQTGNVFLVDAPRVMQFGPRTPQAAADLAVEIKDNMIKNGS